MYLYYTACIIREKITISNIIFIDSTDSDIFSFGGKRDSGKISFECIIHSTIVLPIFLRIERDFYIWIIKRIDVYFSHKTVPMAVW